MRIPSRCKRVRTVVFLAILAPVLPLTVGGCPPDFRNSVIDSVQGAVQTVVVNGGDPAQASVEALRGIAGAAIDSFFSRFRESQTLSS